MACLLLSAFTAGPQQEPGASPELRQLLDGHFAGMTEEWKKEFADRLSALLSGPALTPDARTSVLKALPKIVASATSFLADARELQEDFPKLGPSEAEIRAGALHSAAMVEAFVREAATPKPMTPESKAAAVGQLKSLEDHAVRIVDERLVGDRQARDLVAQSVRKYFRDYEGDIGDPLRPFFSRPLSPKEMADVMARMSEAVPTGNQYDLSGIGKDTAANTYLLNELGVNELIYQVAVLRMYLSVSRLSWGDPGNRDRLVAAEKTLLEWRAQMRQEVADRLNKQLVSEEERARVQRFLESEAAPPRAPSGSPPPKTRPEPVPPAAPVDAEPGSRFLAALGLIGIAIVAALLLLRGRQRTSSG